MRAVLGPTFAFVLLVGCGSGDGGGSSTDAADSAGARLRFQYDTTWAAHLGCTSIRDYRIKFGASPVPVTAAIDVMSTAPGAYVEVDGRTYPDADVLHLYTCDGSSEQNFGRFGTDLALVGGKRYTVTLSGAAAMIVEDP